MGFYEKYLLPPLLTKVMSAKPITYQRKKVVPLAEGRVLEIGIGAGHNIPFYNRAKVSSVIGLEPSHAMRVRAEARAKEAGLPVEFIELEAEAIPLADKSVDTVLVTYTLCTIPDALAALSGMGRVLKPGGKLIFCEHGKAPDEGVRKWQSRIEPVWRRIAGGCHLTRDIPHLLHEGGFSIDKMETMYLPSTPRFAGFNYWGVAQRA